MSKITMTKLKDRIDSLNKFLGRPTEPYHQDKKGKNVPNAGCFMLDASYGGYQLECMCEGGGVYIILPRGTAKELMYGIEGMFQGIREHRTKMESLF